MVLNRNEQRAIEGLFQRDTLDKSHAWDGKYGTKLSSFTEDTFHQHHWGSEKQTLNRTVDANTYRLGVSNPAWKWQIANHTDAGTAFAATDIVVKMRKKASYYVEWLPDWHADQAIAYGWVDPIVLLGQSIYDIIPLYDTSMDVTIDNRALAKLYQKIDATVQGATFLGELRETVDLFRSPLKSLNSAIDKQVKASRKLRQEVVTRERRLANRRYSGVKIWKDKKKLINRDILNSWREAAASSFLEWRWGVEPLLNDIDELFVSLGKSLDQPAIDTFRQTIAMHYPLDDQTVDLGAYSIRCDAVVKTVCHTSVSYQCAVKSRINTSADLSATLGVAPLDWVPAAYELMPLSWLLDYFGNLGQLLNCWVSAQRCESIYISKTIRHSLSSDVSLSPYMQPGTYDPWRVKTATYQTGRMVVKKKHVSRNPLSNFPLPTLMFAPTILSPIRAGNLAAFASLKGEGVAFANRSRL